MSQETTPDSHLPVLRVPRGERRLPPNSLWENRFHIRSESSNRLYIVAQNKAKRHWACSCPSYRTRRYCKHLQAVGLPTGEKPYEVRLEEGN